MTAHMSVALSCTFSGCQLPSSSLRRANTASICASAAALLMGMADPQLSLRSKPERADLRLHLIGRNRLKGGFHKGFLLPDALDPVGTDDLSARRVGIHGHDRPTTLRADGIPLLELRHGHCSFQNE